MLFYMHDFIKWKIFFIGINYMSFILSVLLYVPLTLVRHLFEFFIFNLTLIIL